MAKAKGATRSRTSKSKARPPSRAKLKVGGSVAAFKRVKGSAASIGTPPTAGVQ